MLPEPHRGTTVDLPRAVIRGGIFDPDDDFAEWWTALGPGEVLITSMYGPRDPVQDPDTGVWTSTFHHGIDLVANPGVEGTAYYSLFEGFVAWLDYNAEGFGHALRVRSLDGRWMFEIFHLRERTPWNVGDRVRVHDVLGYLGDTGLSTGPHCHFGLLASDGNGGWYYVDPIPFLISLRDVGEMPPPPALVEGEPVAWLSSLDSLVMQYSPLGTPDGSRSVLVFPQRVIRTWEGLTLACDGRAPISIPAGKLAEEFHVIRVEK